MNASDAVDHSYQDSPPIISSTPHPVKADNTLMNTGWQGAALAIAPAALAACGGGSGSGSVSNPGLLSATTPVTVAEVARFLAQATLGANKSELLALQQTTYAQWIDAQFALPPSQTHYDWLIAKGYNADTQIFSYSGLDNTIWRKLIGGTDSLRQRVTLALSEICVVSTVGVNSSWRQFAVANYLDILEANAFGNYRTLLDQISLSPTMGVYLTFAGNTKSNPVTGSQPDENYAREVMQLFTIGLVQLNSDGTPKLTNGLATDTYTQDDVSQLARVFTGWDMDGSGLSKPYPPDIMRRPLTQVSSRYETGAKTFLGVTIPAGTSADAGLKIALDTLFNHPNLPPFVSKQLIQRLVTSNPGAAYVGRVSAIFSNNGAGVRGDMKAVVKAILLDVEARDTANVSSQTFGKVREPVVRFLNWARAFGASSATDVWAVGDLSDPATKLGQSPMHSPTVFNFFRPGFVPAGSPIADAALLSPEFQITTESSVAGYVNFMQKAISGSGIGDVKASYSELLLLVDDIPALLAELNLVLAANQIPAAMLTMMQTALATIAVITDAGKLNRIYAAVTLVMATPAYIVQK
jgi:uncharacterized protein (DUF1800 family)